MFQPYAGRTFPRRGTSGTFPPWGTRVAFLAASTLVLATACFRIELGDGAGYDDLDMDVDAMVEEELAAGNYAEATNWLHEPGNMLFEGDSEAVQELIDDLYAAGANSVWFTGIEDFGGAKVSASIAVDMPSDPSVRAELLLLEAEFWGEDPQPDVDQRYLSFYFD